MRSPKQFIRSTIIYIEKQIAFEHYRPSLVLGLLVNPLFLIRRNLYKLLRPYLGALDGQILDFGAGSAPYKNLTSSSKYVCLDFENEGHPNQNNKIDIYYDGDSIPFLDGSFDSIICTEVLEHVPNTEEIMRELYRVLKPGGRAIFTIPFVWNEHEIPYDFYRFTQFGIAKKLEEAGFIIVENKKTTCTVHTITQLVSNAMHLTLFTRNLYINIIINFLFIFPVNFIGLLIGYIIPDRKKRLPLNIIILAQK